MGTKEFNTILLNMDYREVTSGEHKGMEMISDRFIVVFDLDCDISVKHFAASSYLNPEEYEIDQSKAVSNVQVFSDDYETEFTLNNIQKRKIEQEITDNLTVVY